MHNPELWGLLQFSDQPPPPPDQKGGAKDGASSPNDAGVQFYAEWPARAAAMAVIPFALVVQ